jgi:protein TonB
VLLALVINAVLFLGIPWLTERDDATAEREYEGAVLLAASPEPPAEVEPERPRPERELPPQLPDLASPPTPQTPQPPETVRFELALDTPTLNGATMVAPLVEAPPAPPLSGPRLFEVGEVDTAPRVLRGAPPSYPFHARRQGIAGRVVARFLVDAKGGVSQISIVEATPRGVFDASVLQAVARWRFSPGMLEGVPVNTWVVAPFEFKL